MELLFGKLEFFKISGPEGKKESQSFGTGKFFLSWARLFKAGLDKPGLASNLTSDLKAIKENSLEFLLSRL